MREIKVELGKTDEEMESDPALSIANLMHFEPDAEDGDFDLVMQVLCYVRGALQWGGATTLSFLFFIYRLLDTFF